MRTGSSPLFHVFLFDRMRLTAIFTGMSELTVGAKAPAFSLPDQSGKKISLADFKGKTVVLYFYPKDDTPGCTTEACTYRDEYSAFKK